MRSEESAESRPEGCRAPRAAVKVRRGLGLLPAGPSPASTPPAPPAAARTRGWPRRAHAALRDCLVLPSIGKTRARRGLSPRPVTPPGVGVVKIKIEKLQRPHRRGDPIAIQPTHPRRALPPRLQPHDTAPARLSRPAGAGPLWPPPRLGRLGTAPRLAAYPEWGVDGAWMGRARLGSRLCSLRRQNPAGPDSSD